MKKSADWLLVLLLGFQFSQAQNFPHLPKTKHHFVVVAHRGDHTHAPENTLAAYRNAIQAGADYVEIDLRTTSDSQLVIMHDGTVDRMTDGKGRVRDLSFAQIRALKVQQKNHPEWGVQRVPTFQEVLQTCRGKINIYLDFKDADVQLAYNLLKKYDMDQHVIVYINEDFQFEQWRKVAPEMPLMISLPEEIKDDSTLGNYLHKVKVEVLDGDYDQYNAAMVRLAQQQGAAVIPDIQHPVEDPDLWNKAIRLGVNGLQSDHPGDLVKYLLKAGIR